MTSGIIPEEKKKALELVPLRRMGQPEDIAHVATFLASERRVSSQDRRFM
jgi:NAD(P)-dependent dehydrogenase (short-subunit alcohol dehydrogenase family)